jgi:hypothetical protein
MPSRSLIARVGSHFPLGFPPPFDNLSRADRKRLSFAFNQESNADCRSIATWTVASLRMSRNDSPKNRAQPVKI